MDDMGGGRLWSFFHGLWVFNREVRALKTPHCLLASITDGHASFIPWTCHGDQPQSHQTELTEPEWTGVPKQAPGRPPDPQPAASPGRILVNQEPRQPCLLYREQGLLTNHESASPAMVNRQYVYCFPSDCPSAHAVTVYHCSAKNRTDSALNPCNRALTEESLSASFSKGEHFHDLRFPQGKGGEGLMLKDLQSECTHYCDPDVYEGELYIQDAQKFAIRWKVTGPHKSFSIQTDFKKKEY